MVGLLVQRSRFCNTAALRDAILFKTFRNTKALLVAMMILTIGFTAFLTMGDGHPMHFDVGLNQVAGLFLFGVGMVLAGACTVSTWVKTGEGNIGALWALLFTFIGMFLFSLLWSYNYWPPAPASMTGEPNAGAAVGIQQRCHAAGEVRHSGHCVRHRPDAGTVGYLPGDFAEGEKLGKAGFGIGMSCIRF